MLWFRRVPNDPSPKMSKSSQDSATKTTSSSRRAGKSQSFSTAFSETSSDANTDSFKTNLRSRMWKFLFTNVDRAVDELYYFCEDEMDELRTKEAVSVLKRCLTDFEQLIIRADEQKRFEKVSGEGHQGGISWEVRKTSVGVRRSQVLFIIYDLLSYS